MWTAFKLFFGSPAAIGTFLLKYGIYIIALLAFLFYVHIYNNALDRADKAEFDLKVLVDANAAANVKRKAENAYREALAKTTLDASEKLNKTIIDKLKLDRVRETNNLKELYAKQSDDRNAITNNNWLQRLRMHTITDPATGHTTLTSDTNGFAESERDCNAGFITLENACKITTVDYNRLRAWADIACQTVECR